MCGGRRWVAGDRSLRILKWLEEEIRAADRKEIGTMLRRRRDVVCDDEKCTRNARTNPANKQIQNSVLLDKSRTRLFVSVGVYRAGRRSHQSMLLRRLLVTATATLCT